MISKWVGRCYQDVWALFSMEAVGGNTFVLWSRLQFCDKQTNKQTKNKIPSLSISLEVQKLLNYKLNFFLVKQSQITKTQSYKSEHLHT